MKILSYQTLKYKKNVLLLEILILLLIYQQFLLNKLYQKIKINMKF